jgi:hypothetical protein
VVSVAFDSKPQSYCRTGPYTSNVTI